MHVLDVTTEGTAILVLVLLLLLLLLKVSV
jgi:hypothetical protein